MISTETMSKIDKYGQRHLLKYYEELTHEERENYDEQLNGLKFDFLDMTSNKDSKKKSHYEPLQVLRMDEIEKNREKYERAGIEAIKNCKVGAVLLAGGQGTRLGYDKPKGMFNIGITKEVYIFERLIRNMLDVVDKIGSYIPLFIMTSEKNDKDTRDFFKEKNYFGYDKKFVYFFVQDMAPCIDYNGKFIMEDKHKVASSPNGNGGWFSSMVSSGLLEKINRMGIEWLNVFAVDNVLQRIADPTFVGATILSDCPAGAKVVKKATPDERVGVMCKENGKPSIVEYYEVTKEMAEAKDAYGEPAYNYGVILNYLFKVDELVDINDNKMINHMVEKKIPFINEKGDLISPEEPNGYKFETLILDMINMLDDCLVFEVERKKEFAPVKNKEGVDSIDTARELLKYNGVQL